MWPAATTWTPTANSCTGGPRPGGPSSTGWGTTAPAPPTANTDPEFRQPGISAYSDPAGDRAVILQWDNASETLERSTYRGRCFSRLPDMAGPTNWQRPEGVDRTGSGGTG